MVKLSSEPLILVVMNLVGVFVKISHGIARLLWKQYFAKVDGVVFIVDAEDKERFPEAKQELSVCLF